MKINPEIKGRENTFIVVDLYEDVVYSSDSRDEAFAYAEAFSNETSDPDTKIYELIGEIK